SNGDTSIVHHGTSQTFPIRLVSRRCRSLGLSWRCRQLFDCCVRLVCPKPTPTKHQFINSPTILPCLPATDVLVERSTPHTPRRGRCLIWRLLIAVVTRGLGVRGRSPF
ncbi:unnamed protein product, partial [Laminaria digitata]